MSINVLVIPEDFRKDQYMLKPIIEKMMAALDVKANVRVCADPLLGGVGEALKWERISDIIQRYRGMTRIFILAVDRDGDAAREGRLRGMENQASNRLGAGKSFLAENAWQELEVWVLAGLKDLPANWSWQEIRAERDPKERYYKPYAEARGVLNEPYEGRGTLAKEAARNYQRIRQLCPEDIQSLEARIRAALGK